MAMSGVKVSDDVVDEYKDMKLKTNATKIMYCEIDDNGIIVKKKSGHFAPAENDTEDAKRSTSKPVNPDDDHEGKYNSFKKDFLKVDNYKKQPAYVIYDFHYIQSNGTKGEKVVLIFWVPEDAPVKKKMLYASSKEALSKKLDGIALVHQANDEDELTYEAIRSALLKNK